MGGQVQQPPPAQPPSAPCIWAAGQIMGTFTTTPGVYWLRFPGRQLDPPALTSRNVPEPWSPCWWETANPLCTAQVNTTSEATVCTAEDTESPVKIFAGWKFNLFKIIVNGVHSRERIRGGLGSGSGWHAAVRNVSEPALWGEGQQLTVHPCAILTQLNIDSMMSLYTETHLVLLYSKLSL